MSKKSVFYLLAVAFFGSVFYFLAVDVCESVVYLLVVDVFGSVVYLLVVDICESFVGFGEKADDKPGIWLAIHSPNPNITTIYNRISVEIINGSCWLWMSKKLLSIWLLSGNLLYICCLWMSMNPWSICSRWMSLNLCRIWRKGWRQIGHPIGHTYARSQHYHHLLGCPIQSEGEIYDDFSESTG